MPITSMVINVFSINIYNIQRIYSYSGSDISVLVRDTLMAPIRAAMRATHWKRMPNPKPESGVPDTLLTPCLPTDEGAIPMNIMDIENPKELLLPDITPVNTNTILYHLYRRAISFC